MSARGDLDDVLGRQPMANCLAVFFFSGATLALLSMLVPHRAQPQESAVRLLAISAYPIAGVLWRRGRRLPVLAFHVALVAGVGIVTGAVVLGTRIPTSGITPIFYVWAAVYAATFFSPPAILVHLALMAGGYAAALAGTGASDASARWLLVVGTLGVTSFVVGRLAAGNRTLARTDALTGLPNRRAFDSDLRRVLATGARAGTPVCLALIDLDDFKHVNDEYGHHTGDEVLVRIACSWLRELRASDCLARWGGDEFMLALASCDAELARRTLERLASATPDVHFSAGIVQWDGVEPMAELVRRADEELYGAKHRRVPRVLT